MDEKLKNELSVLEEISSVIVRERDVKTLLNQVLAVLNRRMGMLRGTVTLRHGDTLDIEAAHGLDESEQRLGHYRIGEGLTGHVAETGRPHVIPDIRRDRRFLNRTGSRHYGDTEQVAFICVPIRHHEELIGTLSIDRLVEKNTDLDADVALLTIIGNITADAASLLLREEEEREVLLD